MSDLPAGLRLVIAPPFPAFTSRRSIGPPRLRLVKITVSLRVKSRRHYPFSERAPVQIIRRIPNAGMLNFPRERGTFRKSDVWTCGWVEEEPVQMI